MRLTVIPFTFLCATCLFAASPQPAAARPPQSSLTGLSFLVGHWEASGSGNPGRSAGEFSFEWAAGQHALLRRNESRSANGVHSDIMLVYAQPDGTMRAVYADSEGHTINYGATVVPGKQRVVFESKGPGPRFRLWYQTKQDGSLATGFEIAPPGAKEFKTYLQGVAHRK